MTVLRKLIFILAPALFFAAPLTVSAQSSLQNDAFAENDDPFEDFNDEFDEQRRRIAEGDTRGRVITKNSAGYVANAMEAIQAPNYTRAVAQADRGLAVHGLSAYEKSVLYQLRAAATLKQGDYDKAVVSYEKAIATGGMTPDEIEKVKINIDRLNQLEG